MVYDARGSALSETFDGTFEVSHFTNGTTLLMRAESAAVAESTRSSPVKRKDFIDENEMPTSSLSGSGCTGDTASSNFRTPSNADGAMNRLCAPSCSTFGSSASKQRLSTPTGAIGRKSLERVL